MSLGTVVGSPVAGFGAPDSDAASSCKLPMSVECFLDVGGRVRLAASPVGHIGLAFGLNTEESTGWEVGVSFMPRGLSGHTGGFVGSKSVGKIVDGSFGGPRNPRFGSVGSFDSSCMGSWEGSSRLTMEGAFAVD